MDFAGPFLGKTFLILVDALSKWLEAITVSTPSSQQAIKALRHIFSTHGLPEVLVSAFTCMHFATFVKRNGHDEHGYWVGGRNLDTHLSRSLFQYRLIPYSFTVHSPA